MSVVLDVVIGLAFLYALLALIATTVQELIATWLRFRAADLYEAIADMLATRSGNGAIQNERLLDRFYAHPLIKNLRQRKLFSNKLHLPSYIPSKTFALALLDILRQDATVSDATGVRPLLVGAEETFGKIEIPELRRTLLLVLENAGLVADRVDREGTLIAQGLEDWFNDHMARASGWYKRRAQLISLVLAAAISVVTNADSIHCATSLWKDGALREAVVANAGAWVAAQAPVSTPAAPAASGSSAPIVGQPAASVGSSSTASAPVPSPPLRDDAKRLEQQLRANIDMLQEFPIGWTSKTGDILPRTILGWLLTAIAVSLGAGFWFDVLSKALQLRGTGPKVSATTGETTSDS